MEKVLIVVDMQNDFIDGALGTAEAVKIVPHAMEKIKNFNGKIYCTLDTHTEDYLQTSEGRHLPVVHCRNIGKKSGRWRDRGNRADRIMH